MAAHFGAPKFSGPMTRSRSSQLEQGLYKSGSCKDFMEYQNNFAFTAFLSRWVFTNSKRNILNNSFYNPSVKLFIFISFYI